MGALAQIPKPLNLKNLDFHFKTLDHKILKTCVTSTIPSLWWFLKKWRDWISTLHLRNPIGGLAQIPKTPTVLVARRGNYKIIFQIFCVFVSLALIIFEVMILDFYSTEHQYS
jgi:hypothetical protein